MIVLKPTHDGTYTIYRDGRPIITGLTRQQADEFASAARSKVVHSPE
jgi:hypothetical protein